MKSKHSKRCNLYIQFIKIKLINIINGKYEKICKCSMTEYLKIKLNKHILELQNNDRKPQKLYLKTELVVGFIASNNEYLIDSRDND